VVSIGWVVLNGMRGEEALDGSETSALPALTLQDTLLGRVVVGLHALFPDPSMVSVIESQAVVLRDGNHTQKLAWVVLQGKLKGAAQGVEALDAFDDEEAGDSAVDEAIALVRAALVAAEEGHELDQEVRDELEATFGYFGEVAISLSDAKVATALAATARTGAIALLAVVSIFGLAGLCGGVGLIIMVTLLILRGPRSSEPLSYHGLYAETFALWLIVFFGLQLLNAVSGWLPTMLGSVLCFFVSLIVLGWPCVRGVAWAQVRADIGWTRPKAGALEPFVGVGTWAMALPFMGAGLALTLILTAIIQAMTGDAPEASHPVQQEAMGAGAGGIAMLFIVACVAAPIVEETFFRGVLYSHLRSWSAKWGFWISIAVSMVVSSFVFAAIHPQGLVFAPPLMGLAVGFAIGREWRGSLVAPMVAHGLNNALVMTLNVILFA
jgi:membrane protease YdiL (CAAX protease family)